MPSNHVPSAIGIETKRARYVVTSHRCKRSRKGITLRTHRNGGK